MRVVTRTRGRARGDRGGRRRVLDRRSRPDRDAALRARQRDAAALAARHGERRGRRARRRAARLAAADDAREDDRHDRARRRLRGGRDAAGGGAGAGRRGDAPRAAHERDPVRAVRGPARRRAVARDAGARSRAARRTAPRRRGPRCSRSYERSLRRQAPGYGSASSEDRAGRDGRPRRAVHRRTASAAAAAGRAGLSPTRARRCSRTASARRGPPATTRRSTSPRPRRDVGLPAWADRLARASCRGGIGRRSAGARASA